VTFFQSLQTFFFIFLAFLTFFNVFFGGGTFFIYALLGNLYTVRCCASDDPIPVIPWLGAGSHAVCRTVSQGRACDATDGRTDRITTRQSGGGGAETTNGSQSWPHVNGVLSALINRRKIIDIVCTRYVPWVDGCGSIRPDQSSSCMID